jgi:hypothetical protein
MISVYPKILLLLIGLTFACVTVASTARTDCLQWHLSGQFTFIRSDGRKLTVGSLRHGQTITGQAYYYEKRLYWGDLKGYIEGHDFNVTIHWQWAARREIYEGHVDAQGHLSGTTYEEDHPDRSATWYTKQQLRCASP